MAYKLGVTIEQLRDAISTIEPMSHRLELIENTNGFVIIDNSYNSSVESSKMALDTLALFKNRKKIIATPGIVEMGNLERDVNFNFGRQIAEVCDKVIIINKVNFEAIKDGALSNGFKENDILSADSLKKAMELFPTVAKFGDVILFENDLPDNYT